MIYCTGCGSYSLRPEEAQPAVPAKEASSADDALELLTAETTRMDAVQVQYWLVVCCRSGSWRSLASRSSNGPQTKSLERF